MPVVLAAPAYAPAFAQVSVDMHALDQAQPQHQGQPTTPAPQTPATAKPEPHRSWVRHPVTHPQARNAHPAKPAETSSKPAPAPASNAPAATLPTAPPPEVRLAPASPAPPVQAQPETPPASSPEAGTDVLAVGDGLRITFLPGRSDITPDTEDVLRRFARTIPDSPGLTIDVRAYASGSADDASSARRMSLSRSLAVRGALIAGGVPSTQVFVRAFGPNAGDAPADRVDVLLNRPAQDTSKPQPAAAAPPAAGAARTAAP